MSYIKLMQLKNWGSRGGLKNCDCSLWAPLTLFQILSNINMMYLKRSHFLCRQSIQTAKFYFSLNFFFEKNKKKSIFCFDLIHIGALCSTSLGCFRQVLEWTYQKKNLSIFLYIIFQKILNLAKKVAKYQVCHLLHKNESP